MEGSSRFILVFCVLLLTACGSETSPAPPVAVVPAPGNPGDPGSGNDSGDEEADDDNETDKDNDQDDDTAKEPGGATKPVATLLTEGEIGPNDSFKVQFDRDIDPAGIGGIVLRQPDAGETVPLAAEYDAEERVVTLTPLRSLNESNSQEALHYALDTNSVKAAGTQAEGAGAAREKGGAQPLPPIIRVRPVLLEDYIVRNTDTGEISSYWHYSWQEEGKTWRVVHMFSGPGDDGDWFDIADNEYSGMFATELLTGNAYRRIWYDGPGGNGRWDGGVDDEIKGITLHQPSGLQGQESTIDSEAPGADGDWFTYDDDYNVVHVRHFDPATRILLYAYGARSNTPDLGPGEDGEWLTSDDTFRDYEKHFYDEQLRLLRIERYRKGKNDDGDWFSEDDLLYGYTEYDYDEAGRLAEYRSFYLPSEGANFVFGSLERYKYNGDLRHYAYAVSHNPQSDEITSYIRHDRTVDGTLLRYGVFHGAGDDANWFSDDDPSGNFSEYEMDERGLPVLRWNYDGYGPDRLWFTGNESVNSLVKLEYDDKGRILRSDYYTDPGEDDTWNTSYDVLSFTVTYHVPQDDTDQ